MQHKPILILLLALFSAPGGASESENVELVKAMAEMINARELESLHTIVAEDVVRHSGATPGVVVTSLGEFIAFLETDIAAVPDSVQEIDTIFGSGDMVAMRARYSGTHRKLA
jgi:predicted ester cyclase